MKRLATVAAAAALAGCSASLGSMGVLLPEASSVGLKVLRPGVRGRSCRASIAGLPLDAGEPELREAVAQVLARGTVTPVDQGGSATTSAIGDAVAAAVE